MFIHIGSKKSSDGEHHSPGLSQPVIVGLVILILVGSVVIVFGSQMLVEREVESLASSIDTSMPKELFEIVKLNAEIKQIESNISGSLFWLKMIALFVTVGSAVGGYLIGQSRATRARIEFEDRKRVDAEYQALVQELSDDSPLLRAAAVVKLGMLLKSFPHEWSVSEERRDQLIDLTKQVLATLLSIESETKVLKTLTSAISLHHPWKDDEASVDKKAYGDLREIDLSGAKAQDAYWARVDFTYADFYQADIRQASLRKSILHGAQFRETNLRNAVLVDADCTGANFKFADLRNADLSGAQLTKANFEATKVHGVTLGNTVFGGNPETMVDISPEGDGIQMVPFQEWLAAHQD